MTIRHVFSIETRCTDNILMGKMLSHFTNRSSFPPFLLEYKVILQINFFYEYLKFFNCGYRHIV